MSIHYLTPAQTERLAILVEECAEVQQIAMKIFRHGKYSSNPTDPTMTTNIKLLEKELGDLLFAAQLMIGAKDISVGAIQTSASRKKQKIKDYLHSPENIAYCNA